MSLRDLGREGRARGREGRERGGGLVLGAAHSERVARDAAPAGRGEGEGQRRAHLSLNSILITQKSSRMAPP